ncbi:MAG: hypothetical protein CMJ81_22200 [Planctomycetaceae bacterium]|nr:hypothetical protein [Planctomycetaceae bacterium]MBP63205.1 hypothetical protein [Planctomycetaceae bacterium]
MAIRLFYNTRQTRSVSGTLPRAAFCRAAFTLVELLVVVTILLMLMGLAAAFVSPLREGRDIREAARQVSTYLTAAQSRAIELQRPVAVSVRPLRDDNGNVLLLAALELWMAEVPEPYTGDHHLAVAEIALPEPPGNAIVVTLHGVSNHPTNPIYHNVDGNDFIRFDGKGPRYQIASWIRVPPDDTDTDKIQITLYEKTTYHTRYFKAGSQVVSTLVPFQVFRYGRPLQSLVSPLQLPPTVAIDMVNCGEGRTGVLTVPDMTILFSPAGGVERFIINGMIARPTSAFHLLLGRIDQLGPGNLEDGNSRWISIRHLTGRVTTSENKSAATVDLAREFAVQAQSMRGI